MLDLRADSGEFQWVSPRGYLTILLLLVFHIVESKLRKKGGHEIKIWVQTCIFIFHIVDSLYPMIFQWILVIGTDRIVRYTRKFVIKIRYTRRNSPEIQ